MKQIRNELSHQHNIKAYRPVHTEREALYWQQRVDKQQSIYKNKILLHSTISPYRNMVESMVDGTVNHSTSSTGNKLQSEGRSI